MRYTYWASIICNIDPRKLLSLIIEDISEFTESSSIEIKPDCDCEINIPPDTNFCRICGKKMERIPVVIKNKVEKYKNKFNDEMYTIYPCGGDLKKELMINGNKYKILINYGGCTWYIKLYRTQYKDNINIDYINNFIKDMESIGLDVSNNLQLKVESDN